MHIGLAEVEAALAAITAQITSLQTQLTAQTTSVTTLTTTTIPNLTTKYLRKDIADSTPYQLGVPVSGSMGSAVQKSELVGGIQRPYRIFQNVGATATGAYVRAGQNATIVDALGLGQVYAITAVRVKTLTAGTLAGTFTLTNSTTSTVVFQTTVILTSIPAVGKIIDLLTLTGTALPTDVVLPATLVATATGGGTYEIIVDGLLK